MFLVTGATGGLGRRIVRQLREQNLPVRAFVRLNARYSELEQRGAEIFVGNLLNDRDIEKACRGVRVVISAHGANATGEGDAQSIDYRANIELIDQAKAQGAEHFVFTSVLGADRGYEDAPVFKAKREVEKYLQQQADGLGYTILRPSGFASNLLPLAERFRQTGIYLLIGEPQNRTSIVSTDDLARIAVASASLDAARNRVFNIGGPEALSRDQIPKIFGRIFNREPIIINPPLLLFDGLRGAVGLVSPSVSESLGTLRALLANEYLVTPAEVALLETTFGFQPESLEHFLRRCLGI
ncbi:SDR family oxidoreductase [Leptolyngbya sp. FACHB-261]|nr:SDR family oxidoreductase [Leptolyngbya sp. FACHB-261]